MRQRLRLRPQHLYLLYLLEAALLGWFFFSSVRFLIGMLYSRAGSVSMTLALDPALILAGTPGIVQAATLQSELTFLFVMLLLPLVATLFGRFPVVSVVGVALLSAGRLFMLGNSAVSPVIGAALALGGGLVYITALVRWRATTLAYFFVLGAALDQAARAVGNTLDPTWSSSFASPQAILSIAAFAISIVAILWQLRRKPEPLAEGSVNLDHGLMPFWGGVGFGGLLFLQLALLSTPNALAHRAGVDYTNFAPLVMLATLLPLIPAVRAQAAALVGLFDRSARGWAWMLLMALLIVFGTRFQGLIAGAALVFAQFSASLLWWWLTRPRTGKERSFSGLWLLIGVGFFGLLLTADNFTYEYAYVQDMGGDLAFLNTLIPPFLRGFRGMGLGILLLSVFLAALPMVMSQRRIPWASGSRWLSFFTLVLVAAGSLGIAAAVQPPIIIGVRNPDTLRFGSYNIHSGFNEFYHFDLDAIARTIQQSGSNVTLLQQVETGRLTSFSVDQSLWLARRLGMDTRFFATNEGLQGLAVLSNVPFREAGGTLLVSPASQVGLQWVQIQPDDAPITLYNTRLEYLLETSSGRSLDDQEQDQQRQLNEIFTILGTRHPDGNLGRTLLGGTFNNLPDSALGDQMRSAGFVDPFAGLPNDLTATLWRAGLPQVQLDYLWVWRRTLVPVGANTINTNASDHRLAVIEAIIRPQ
jgi:endonuclease/exonuclease/phosphatase family metal-dependent hydrolase